MYNWKLPHVISPLNVWAIALWQHTIFTEVMDKTYVFQSFCVSNKKNSDGKKLTPTQHLHDIGCRTLPTAILTLIKTDDA